MVNTSRSNPGDGPDDCIRIVAQKQGAKCFCLFLRHQLRCPVGRLQVNLVAGGGNGRDPPFRCQSRKGFKARNADCWLVQSKRQPPGGRDRDANSSEIARTRPDTDRVDIRPRNPAFCQDVLKQRHQAFRLAAGHGFGAAHDDVWPAQQSGRAMRGRCVKCQNCLIRRQQGEPRSPRGCNGGAGSRSPFSGSASRTGSLRRPLAYAGRRRRGQSRGR